MAIWKIDFQGTVNDSFQINDEVYAVAQGTNSITGNDLVGKVSLISDNRKTINVENGFAPGVGKQVVNGDFIMFHKDSEKNISSLSGYYAETQFYNNSSEKAELFAIGSEITESSK